MSKTDSYFNREQYATVAERIEMFYSRYPQGRINTELVSRADGAITFKAVVFRDARDTTPAATGWASEREGDSDINTVACLENTETSAVGRALANLGFVASAKRPSREEMEKVFRVRRHLAVHENRGCDAPMRVQSAGVDDLLRLLSVAERRGLSSRRLRTIRERVTEYPGLSISRIRRIEQLVRAWVRRRHL
jgi:hypothetical protein